MIFIFTNLYSLVAVLVKRKGKERKGEEIMVKESKGTSRTEEVEAKSITKWNLWGLSKTYRNHTKHSQISRISEFQA